MTSSTEQPIASASTGVNLHPLLTYKPTSSILQSHLSKLSASPVPPPIIAAFSDCIYYNYHPLGLSLVYHPLGTYKPKTGATKSELDESLLKLSSIDLYNHEATLNPPPSSKASRSSSLKPIFAPFPSFPLLVTYPSISPPFTPQTLAITPESTGKDFILALGEPDRKGGGEGSIGIWIEWTSVGILVEFASGGLQAWDKGGEAVWRVLTVFERGVAMGKEEGEEE